MATQTEHTTSPHWQPTKAFYVPGNTNLVDVATIHDTGMFSGETVDQMQARYPGVQLLDIETAIDLCEQSAITKHDAGIAKPITKEQYHEMLEILPPSHWAGKNGSESFQMCETLSNGITACYVRIGGKYYTVNAKLGTPHDELVKMCNQ